MGADVLLLVPRRIGCMKMPAPRQFAIEVDPKPGHLARVVTGASIKATSSNHLARRFMIFNTGTGC